MRTTPGPHLDPAEAPPPLPFPSPSRLIKEARLRPRMARRPGRLHPQQHRIQIAVQPNLEHLHRVARRLTLPPQPTLARAEPRLPALPRAAPRLLVHVGEHQHLARTRV